MLLSINGAVKIRLKLKDFLSYHVQPKKYCNETSQSFLLRQKKRKGSILVWQQPPSPVMEGL